MLVFNIIGCATYAIFSSFNPDKTYAFYVCIAAALLSGANQSIGEGVMIAFIKKFPSQCISGWSSGTGFAGLVGAGLYLAFKSFHVRSFIVFSSIIPFIILYGIIFIWLDRNQPAKKYGFLTKPESIIEEYESES
jgi:battenin